MHLHFSLKRCGALTVFAIVTFTQASACDQDRPVTASDTGGPRGAIREGIAGYIVDPTTAPVVDASVQAVSLDNPTTAIPEIHIVSDGKGYYQWPLFPGEYAITVSANGFLKNTQRSTVTAHRVTRLDFVLR